MKLRTFLQTLIGAPLIAGCHIPIVGNSPEEIKHRKGLPSTPDESSDDKEPLKVGDIVKWNQWACYKGKGDWVEFSLVTCVWNDGTVILDDHFGIHNNRLVKVGHCDTITASQGLIHEKI